MAANFALAPAQAVDGPLDYSRAEHHKIYRSGIRAVTDDPFPCDADRLFQFLREVQDRAMEMGWMDGILNVTTNPGEEVPDEENMLENYGTITLEQVIESERTYIGSHVRKAQDTYMLYQCLMASLTSEAKKKVMIWADQYQVETDGARYNSGVALLKIVIRESHLDTNATTNQIRTKLSTLDTYIITIDSDIGKFNQYVKLLIQSLSARNQTTSDLLINLFKGYGAVSDETFRAWLTRKQDDHEEGNEISPDDLMISAKNKYDAMVEKGTWNAPTAEEKIVALEAKLTSTMKNLNKKVSIEMGKKSASTGKSKSGERTKQSGKDGGKAEHPKNWPPPKPGEKKVAKFKEFTYYWCGKDTGGTCEKWRAHKPKDCRGGAPPPNSDAHAAKRTASSDNKDNKKGIVKKLKIAKAYVAKMEQKVAEHDASDENSD
jgi:hypothetical protein